MLRKNLFGMLTNSEELDDNEKAMLYIKECAESVGIEVTEDTAFTIQFMAKIMKALREEGKADE